MFIKEHANGGAEPPSLEQQLADSQTEVAKIVAQQQQSNGIAAAAQGAAGALARGAAGDSQPDDWDRASSRASAFGMLAPQPHRRISSFGILDKQAKYKGLSKTWSHSIAADPTRAGKVFPEDEAAKLANLEGIGRRLLDIKAGIQACVNLVPVDSEAVGLLFELEEEIELAIQSIKGGVDQYTLQWLHLDRFKALAQMQRHYDHDSQSGPACMLPGKPTSIAKSPSSTSSPTRKTSRKKPAPKRAEAVAAIVVTTPLRRGIVAAQAQIPTRAQHNPSSALGAGAGLRPQAPEPRQDDRAIGREGAFRHLPLYSGRGATGASTRPPPRFSRGGLGHPEVLVRKAERRRAIMRSYASGKGFQPHPRSKQGSAMVSWARQAYGKPHVARHVLHDQGKNFHRMVTATSAVHASQGPSVP